MIVLFFFKILVIIGLCNSSANSLLDVFLFLTADLFHVAKVSVHASIAAPPEVILLKNL